MVKPISQTFNEVSALFDQEQEVTAPEDYTTLSGSQLLENNQFLQDLTKYYRTSGQTFTSTEDMLDEWYTDERWDDWNSISKGLDIIEYANAGSDKELIARLGRAWSNAPTRGSWWDKTRDIGGALIADPLNFAGGYGVAAKGAKAAQLATQAGKSAAQAKRAGMVAGAARGAKQEGAISAGVELGFNAMDQKRDIDYGLRDEYSVGDAAKATVIGGTVGGTLGGIIGGSIGRFSGATESAIADTNALAMASDPDLADFSKITDADWIEGGTNLAINTRKRIADLEADIQESQTIINDPTSPDKASAAENIVASQTEINDIKMSIEQVSALERAVVERQRAMDAIYQKAYGQDGKVDTEAQAEVSGAINDLTAEMAALQNQARDLLSKSYLDDPVEVDTAPPLSKKAQKKKAAKKTKATEAKPAETKTEEVKADAAPEPEVNAEVEPTKISALETKVASGIEGVAPKKAVTSFDQIKYNSPSQKAAVRKLLDGKNSVITEQDVVDLFNAGKLKTNGSKLAARTPIAVLRKVNNEIREAAGQEVKEFVKGKAATAADEPITEAVEGGVDAEAIVKQDMEDADDMTQLDSESPVEETEETLDGSVEDYVQAENDNSELEWDFRSEGQQKSIEASYAKFGVDEDFLDGLIQQGIVKLTPKGKLSQDGKKTFEKEAEEYSKDIDEYLKKPKGKTADERVVEYDQAINQENYDGEWGTTNVHAEVVYRAIVEMVSDASDPAKELNRLIDQVSTHEGYSGELKRRVKQMITAQLETGQDPTPNRTIRSGGGRVETAMKREKTAGITFRLEPDTKEGRSVYKGKIQSFLKRGYASGSEDGRTVISIDDVITNSKLSKMEAQSILSEDTRGVSIAKLEKGIARLEKQKAKNKSGKLKPEGEANLAGLKARLATELETPPTDTYVAYKPNGNQSADDLPQGTRFRDTDYDTAYETIVRTADGPKFRTFATLERLNEFLGNVRKADEEEVQSIVRSPEEMTSAVDDALSGDKTLEEKAALIEELRRTTVKPKAKPKTKAKDIPTVPVFRDENEDMVLALVPRDMVGISVKRAGSKIARIINDTQIEAGANVKELLGSLQKNDLNEFAIGYLPVQARKFRSNRRRIEDLFVPLNKENSLGAATEIGRDAEGFETFVPRKMPLTAAETKQKTFKLSDEMVSIGAERAIFKVLDDVGASGVPEELRGGKRLEHFNENMKNREFTLNELNQIIRTYEIAPFTFKGQNGEVVPMQTRLQVLSFLEGLRYDLAPNGFRRPTEKLVEAQKQLGYITQGVSKKERQVAEELLDIVSTENKAPILRFNQDGGNVMGAFDPSTNAVEIADKAGPITFNLTLAHELGHWSWDNIASSQLKREFWEIMSEKFTTPTGQVKSDADAVMEEMSPVFRWGKKNQKSIGQDISEQTPQEMWANQFSMYLLHRKGIDIGEKEFFNRHKFFFEKWYDKIKVLYKKIRGENIFDPQLEPIFRNLIADKREFVYRNYLNPVEAKSSKGKALERRYREVYDARKVLQDKLKSGDPEAVAIAAREIQSALYSMGMSKKDAEMIVRSQNKKIISDAAKQNRTPTDAEMRKVTTSGTLSVMKGRGLSNRMVAAGRRINELIVNEKDVFDPNGNEAGVVGLNTVENVKEFYDTELKQILTEVMERLNTGFQDVEYGDMPSYVPTKDFMGLREVVGMDTINKARKFKEVKRAINQKSASGKQAAKNAVNNIDKIKSENDGSVSKETMQGADLLHANADIPELVRTLVNAKGKKEEAAAKHALADAMHRNFIPKINDKDRRYKEVTVKELPALALDRLIKHDDKVGYFQAMAELANKKYYKNFKINALPDKKSEMRVRLPSEDSLGIDPELDLITTEVLKTKSHRTERKSYVLKTMTTRLIDEGLDINVMEDPESTGLSMNDARKKLRSITNNITSNDSGDVRVGLGQIMDLLLNSYGGANKFAFNIDLLEFKPWEIEDAFDELMYETEVAGFKTKSPNPTVSVMKEALIPMVLDALDFTGVEDLIGKSVLNVGDIRAWKERTKISNSQVDDLKDRYREINSSAAEDQVQELMRAVAHITSGMISSTDAQRRFLPLSLYDIGGEYAQKMRGSPVIEYLDGDVPAVLAKEFSDDLMSTHTIHQQKAIRNWTGSRSPTPLYIMRGGTNGFRTAVADPTRMRYNMDDFLKQMDGLDEEGLEDVVYDVLSLSDAYDRMSAAKLSGADAEEIIAIQREIADAHRYLKGKPETKAVYDQEDFVTPVFVKDDDPLFIPETINVEPEGDGARYLQDISDRLSVVMKAKGRLSDYIPQLNDLNLPIKVVRGVDVLMGMYKFVAASMPHKAQDVERELFRKLRQAGFSTLTVRSPDWAKYYDIDSPEVISRYQRTMAKFIDNKYLYDEDWEGGYANDEITIGAKRYEIWELQALRDIKLFRPSSRYTAPIAKGINSTIILDPAKAKKANDPYFSNLNIPAEKSFMASGAPSMSYVDALMDNPDSAWKARLRAAKQLEAGGIPSASLNTIVKMGKGQKVTKADVEKLNKVSSIFTMKTNGGIIRASGMNWLARFVEPEDGSGGHFERVNAKMGRFLVPLTRKLHRLPNKNGRSSTMVERYYQQGFLQMADATRKGFGSIVGMAPTTRINQPIAHERIAQALRNRGSVDGLRPKEKEVYDDIQQYFKQAHNRLTQAGIQIGEIKEDYFPQIWRRDLIEANEEEFKRNLARYFQEEHMVREGDRLAGEKALAKANSVFLKLTAEDGVLTGDPMQFYSRKTADNADFQRLIRLDQFPDFVKAGNPNNLSKFLENDLLIVMTKYSDNVEHRLDLVDKFGVGGHAHHDYLATISGGPDAISRLLRSNKVLKRNYRTFLNNRLDDDADVDEGGMVGVFKTDHFKAPIQKSGIEGKMLGDKRANALVNMARSGASAQEMFNEMMKSLDVSKETSGHATMMKKNFGKRAEAIANALFDTKGFRELPSEDNIRHAQGSFNAVQRQPIDGFSPLYNGKTTSKWLRSINGVTLLSFTTLTSLGDLVLPLVNSGDFKASFNGIRKFTQSGVGGEEYRDMIRGVGAAVENIVHQRMTTAFGVEATQFSSGFFNMSLLTPWTDTMRDISAATGFEHFKAQQKIAQRYPKTKKGRIAQQILTEYGLADLANVKAPPIEQIMKQSPLGQTHEMYDKVASSVIKFTNQSIFTPNPNDIHLWGQTPIGAMLYQLKSFPMMMARLGGRNIRKARDGNWKPLAYMATVMPAMGYGAASIKDVVQGRGGEENREFAPRDRKLTDSYASAEGMVNRVSDDLGIDADRYLGMYHDGLMMSGGLGFVGEMLVDIANQTDNGYYGMWRTATAIGGPSVSLGGRAVRVLGGVQDAAFDAMGFESTNYKERDAFDASFGLVPFVGQMPAVKENLKDMLLGESSTKSRSSDQAFGLDFDL